MIKPTKEQLNTIPMENFVHCVHPEMRPFLINPPGSDHYRLLNYIGKNFSGKIYEIGTHRGASSAALSDWGRKPIITYDISLWERVEFETNIYRVKNPLEDINEIAKSNLIFYDTSHNGKDEKEFTDALVKSGFSGIIVYDDIYLNNEMKEFWESIKFKKEDWTDVGHWSGTGVVYI